MEKLLKYNAISDICVLRGKAGEGCYRGGCTRDWKAKTKSPFLFNNFIMVYASFGPQCCIHHRFCPLVFLHPSYIVNFELDISFVFCCRIDAAYSEVIQNR